MYIYFLMIIVDSWSLYCMEQLPQLNERNIISYNKLPKDIHSIIFTNCLLKDLSDTEAIKAAKNLALTCTGQYALLLDPIKESFEQFIFSNIDFTQYTINDPLCNLFINILSPYFYSELLNKIQEERNDIDIKINFIEKYDCLSEEKVNNLIIDLNNKIEKKRKKIENLSTEFEDINSEKKPLLNRVGQKK